MTVSSKPHRLSSCHRHPAKPVTGFCASCLRERLAGIESSAGHEYSEQEVQLAPRLRRTKSCSGSGQLASASAISEPRRRSCEVRARSTLWDLFNLDNEKKGMNRKFEVELGSLTYEIREEEQIEAVNEAVRVCADTFAGVMDGGDEIDDEEETKTMKEFIDLELQGGKNAGRDFRDIAGSFWEAASAFSKKLRKWRRKQKMKKHNGSGHSAGVGLAGLKVEKPKNRRTRETQSEVGEYGLGRRSCDTDPRLSLDAGRMSLDDSRISLDMPRASWDGYLIGKACPRLSPMISVVEDTNVSVNVIENRVSSEEKVNLEGAGESNPGGSAQTKDYYSDSLSWQQRRRSFDRSSSHRKPAIPEVDELKLISNAKVSPATTELFYGAKLLITEKELMDRGLKSSNNVLADSVPGSTSEDASDAAIGVNQKGLKKLPNWRKMWNKLGIVQKKKEIKLEEYGAGDVVNKPITDSWQKLRRVVNGQASESVSQKLIRSYSVSCRDPGRTAGLVNGLGNTENKSNVLNGRQDFMLQRNRSARYSPNSTDAGLLRFYLTPLKGYRRSKSVKGSIKDLQPTTRSVL
ncbi:hypothetical protein QN277_018326 [Acacia crassicarpa]|uniref:Uncharacterized protein n=1 Tax=Acacia crassicarpa TaxID=499986 RepID=A0AAE1MSJ9_9FABA|nr:hypothetical protein QN277_018326 [Acacia crassicarpa]